MDNKILNEVMKETTFLNPYLKQFKKYLEEHGTVKELGKIDDKYLNELVSLGLKVSDSKVDGLILINFDKYKENIDLLLEDIDSNLKDEGYLFIVLHTNNKDINKVKYLLESNFLLVEEFIGDESWNFLLYQKSTS